MQKRILSTSRQIPLTDPGAACFALIFRKNAYFCVEMKKRILIIAYWLAAMFLTAILLTSLDYDLGHAVIMSLSFLPAAMALSFYLPQVDRTQGVKERVIGTLCIIFGVMTMAFLLIYLLQMFFILVIDRKESEWSLPSMLWNPVFVAAVLAILAYGHYLLEKWLEKKYPSDRPVTFTSDYKKVKVRKEDILYIESRDSEVWIHTSDGQQYRNKTGISQWENALGPGFLRIHRAFLVNRAEAVLATPESVTVDGKELPISRKYKDAVSLELMKGQPFA